MTIKTYNPGDVSIIFAGIPFEGYAPGTFVTFGRDNDSSVGSVGSDGEGARAMSNDKSGTITCTLMQTSATNLALSELIRLDELTGDGVATMMIKDSSGFSLALAQTAYISKPADGEYARELTTRVWVFKTDHLEILHGGN